MDKKRMVSLSKREQAGGACAKSIDRSMLKIRRVPAGGKVGRREAKKTAADGCLRRLRQDEASS